MITRRSQLAGLGVAAAGLALGATTGGAPASAAPARVGQAPAQNGDPFPLVARRTELTLPDPAPLGVTYICLLDLFDDADEQVGTASAGATVVDVTLEGPVVLAIVVLQLADGEIHYQRILDRFGEYPRTAVGAILGGTGAYAGIRGEVDVSWPDPDVIDLTVRPL